MANDGLDGIPSIRRPKILDFHSAICDDTRHMTQVTVNATSVSKDDLLTLQAVADILSVSKTSLYAWIAEGRLPAIRVGREWRVQRSNLDSWLEDQRTEATA